MICYNKMLVSSCDIPTWYAFLYFSDFTIMPRTKSCCHETILKLILFSTNLCSQFEVAHLSENVGLLNQDPGTDLLTRDATTTPKARTVTLIGRWTRTWTRTRTRTRTRTPFRIFVSALIFCGPDDGQGGRGIVLFKVNLRELIKCHLE